MATYEEQREAERVARNERREAAIAKAIKEGPPVMKLQRRHLGEEAICPRCCRRNAMLNMRWINLPWEDPLKVSPIPLWVCRDCEFACVEPRHNGL